MHSPLTGTGLMQDSELESIRDPEDLIAEVFTVLEELAGTAEVDKWKDTLFDSLDYNNREVVLGWYMKIKRQYRPRLIGRESCTYEWPAFNMLLKRLPVSKVMDACPTCPR